MSERTKGYCEVCDREYYNIYQHRNSKKHKRNEELQKLKQPENNSNENSGNGVEYIETPEIEQTNNEVNEVKEQEQKEVKPPESIQIIDSNTGKKEKSILDEILEKAFSEQFAPITMSLINNILTKATGGNLNNEEEEGQIVETVSGAKVWLKNKEF